MSDYEKYVSLALQIYDDAIRLLERGDVFDAAEKAWCAIENSRKAFLIALGVSEQKASSVEFGVVFFIRVLRKLGRKDLVEKHYNFDYCLRIRGFYEPQMPVDVLSEKIYEVRRWMDEIFELANKVKGLDLSDAIRMMDESVKLKRKILQMNMEYQRMLQQIDAIISRAIAKSSY